MHLNYFPFIRFVVVKCCLTRKITVTQNTDKRCYNIDGEKKSEKTER